MGCPQRFCQPWIWLPALRLKKHQSPTTNICNNILGYFTVIYSTAKNMKRIDRTIWSHSQLSYHTCFQMRWRFVLYPAIWWLGSSVARFNRGLKQRLRIKIQYNIKNAFLQEKSLFRIPNYLSGHRRRGRLGPWHCCSPGLGTSCSPRVIGLHVLRTENKLFSKYPRFVSRVENSWGKKESICTNNSALCRKVGSEGKLGILDRQGARPYGGVGGVQTKNNAAVSKRETSLKETEGWRKILLALWLAFVKFWRHKAWNRKSANCDEKTCRATLWWTNLDDLLELS